MTEQKFLWQVNVSDRCPKKNILSLEIHSDCTCDRMGSMLLFILESLRFEDVNEYEYEI